MSGSSSEPTGRTLAVTGGTGFLGSHVVATARARGHRVRMLVRDPAKAIRVRRMFGLDHDDGIEVVCLSAMLLALGHGQLDLGHGRIIRVRPKEQ